MPPEALLLLLAECGRGGQQAGRQLLKTVLGAESDNFVGPRQRLHAAPRSLLRQPQLTAHALPYRAKRACRLLSHCRETCRQHGEAARACFKVVPGWLRYPRAGGYAPL